MGGVSPEYVDPFTFGLIEEYHFDSILSTDWDCSPLHSATDKKGYP